jgi:hypothetical protein
VKGLILWVGWKGCYGYLVPVLGTQFLTGCGEIGVGHSVNVRGRKVEEFHQIIIPRKRLKHRQYIMGLTSLRRSNRQ